METVKNIYIKIRESLKPEFRHMAIPQTGSSVVVINENDEILLVKKTNGNKWTTPGGVQELGEDFKSVAKRELLEETGINYPEEKLILLDIITGEKRHKIYPNGDEVYNNSVLYLAQVNNDVSININFEDWQDDGSGEYKLEIESSEYGWFNLNDLPDSFDQEEFIEAYQEWNKNQIGDISIDDIISNIDKKLETIEKRKEDSDETI